MSNRLARATLLAFAWLAFLPDHFSAAQVAPQPLQESDGCEVPSVPQGGLELTFAQVDVSGFLILPPPSGSPHLLLPCLEFDRSAYRVGEMWGATFTVTNAGTVDSGTFNVYAQLCRHMADGISFTCTVGVYPLASGEAALAAGESRVITHGPGWGFSELEPDPAGTYPSLVEGFPDNGTVYLRGSISGLGEYTMASALFPSGPELTSPNSGPDADEDGYSPPEDCDDADPVVHPGAPEIVGTGIDYDCAGGSVPASAECPAGSLIVYGMCLPTAPGAPGYPGLLDLDGDTWSTSEGDCDDSQFNVHPGALEFQDGLDNNCNGVIDEVIGTPDFTLTVQSLDEASQPLSPKSAVTEPGILYTVELVNQGMGIPVPLGSIQAVSVEALGDPSYVGAGTTGFIPLRSIPNTACAGGTLRFSVADNGIYGEVEFANNVIEWDWDGEQLVFPDLDLRFDDAPVVLYDNDADGSISIVAGHVADGTCPQPPSYYGVPHVSTRHRVWLNGDLIRNSTTFSEISSFDLSDRLHIGDRICVKLGLNDPALAAESPANNGWAGAYEFHNPVFGRAELRLIDSGLGDPASLSCLAWSASESETAILGATMGSLTGTALTAAPLFGGIGGGLLLGAVGALLGSFVGRRVGFAPARALASGAATGFIAGGVGGVLLLSALANDRMPRLDFDIPPDLRQAAELPACDFYLDASSALPTDGTTFAPGEVISVDLEPVAARDLPPDAYALVVQAPSGQEIWGPWPAPSANPAPLDLVGLALAYPTRFVFSPGTYAWSIMAGFREDNGASPVCRDSTPHSFNIEVPSELLPVSPEAPSVAPSATATPQPTAMASATRTRVPPTATRTPTPIVDTTGPVFKSVSDSPDPIYANTPAGCSPNSSVVSVSVSDPSGVASVVVLFFHTTIGAVPMTNTGGNNWQATLGPYAGVGDGTVDYQVHAVDHVGNATDSGFFQVMVLACLP